MSWKEYGIQITPEDIAATTEAWLRHRDNPDAWRQYIREKKELVRRQGKRWAYLGGRLFYNVQTGQGITLSEDAFREFSSEMYRLATFDQTTWEGKYSRSRQQLAEGPPVSAPMAPMAGAFVQMGRSMGRDLYTSMGVVRDIEEHPEIKDPLKATIFGQKVSDIMHVIQYGNVEIPDEPMTKDDILRRGLKGFYYVGGDTFLDTTGDAPSEYHLSKQEKKILLRSFFQEELEHEEPVGSFLGGGNIVSDLKLTGLYEDLPIGLGFKSKADFIKFLSLGKIKTGRGLYDVLVGDALHPPEDYFYAATALEKAADIADNEHTRRTLLSAARLMRRRGEASRLRLYGSALIDFMHRNPYTSFLYNTAQAILWAPIVAGFGAMAALGAGPLADKGLSEEERRVREELGKYGGTWAERMSAVINQSTEAFLQGFKTGVYKDFLEAPAMRFAVEDFKVGMASLMDFVAGELGGASVDDEVNRLWVRDTLPGQLFGFATELAVFAGAGVAENVGKVLGKGVVKGTAIVGRTAFEQAKKAATFDFFKMLEPASLDKILSEAYYLNAIIGGGERIVETLKRPLVQIKLFGRRLSAEEYSVLKDYVTDLFKIPTESAWFKRIFADERGFMLLDSSLGKLGGLEAAMKRFKMSPELLKAYEDFWAVPEVKNMKMKFTPADSLSDRVRAGITRLTALLRPSKRYYGVEGGRAFDTLPDEVRAGLENAKTLVAYGAPYHLDYWIGKLASIKGLNDRTVAVFQVATPALEKMGDIGAIMETRLWQAPPAYWSQGTFMRGLYMEVASNPEFEAVIKDMIHRVLQAKGIRGAQDLMEASIRREYKYMARAIEKVERKLGDVPEDVFMEEFEKEVVKEFLRDLESLGDKTAYYRLLHEANSLWPWNTEADLARTVDELVNNPSTIRNYRFKTAPTYPHYVFIDGIRRARLYADMQYMLDRYIKELPEALQKDATNIRARWNEIITSYVFGDRNEVYTIPTTGERKPVYEAIDDFLNSMQDTNMVSSVRNIADNVIDGETVDWWINHSDKTLEAVSSIWEKDPALRELFKHTADYYRRGRDVYRAAHGEIPLRLRLGYFHHKAASDIYVTVSTAHKSSRIITDLFEGPKASVVRERKGRAVTADVSSSLGRLKHDPLTDPILFNIEMDKAAAYQLQLDVCKGTDAFNVLEGLAKTVYVTSGKETTLADKFGGFYTSFSVPTQYKKLHVKFESFKKGSGRLSSKELHQAFCLWLDGVEKAAVFATAEERAALREQIKFLKQTAKELFDWGGDWQLVRDLELEPRKVLDKEAIFEAYAKSRFMDIEEILAFPPEGLNERIYAKFTNNLFTSPKYFSAKWGVKFSASAEKVAANLPSKNEALRPLAESIYMRIRGNLETLKNFSLRHYEDEGVKFIEGIHEYANRELNEAIEQLAKNFSEEDAEYILDALTAYFTQQTNRRILTNMLTMRLAYGRKYMKIKNRFYLLPSSVAKHVDKLNNPRNIPAPIEIALNGMNAATALWKKIIFLFRFAFRTTNTLADMQYAITQNPSILYGYIPMTSGIRKTVGMLTIPKTVLDEAKTLLTRKGHISVDDKAMVALYKLAEAEKELHLYDFAKLVEERGGPGAFKATVDEVYRILVGSGSTRYLAETESLMSGERALKVVVKGRLGAPLSYAQTLLVGGYQDFARRAETLPKKATFALKLNQLSHILNVLEKGGKIETGKLARAKLYLDIINEKYRQALAHTPVPRFMRHTSQTRLLENTPVAKMLKEQGEASGPVVSTMMEYFKHHFNIDMPFTPTRIERAYQNDLGRIYRFYEGDRHVATLTDYGHFKQLRFLGKKKKTKGKEVDIGALYAGTFARTRNGWVDISTTSKPLREGNMWLRNIITMDMSFTSGKQLGMAPLLDGIVALSHDVNINYAAISTNERRWLSQAFFPWYTFYSRFLESMLRGAVHHPGRLLLLLGSWELATYIWNHRSQEAAEATEKLYKALEENPANRWARMGFKQLLYLGKDRDGKPIFLAVETPMGTLSDLGQMTYETFAGDISLVELMTHHMGLGVNALVDMGAAQDMYESMSFSEKYIRHETRKMLKRSFGEGWSMLPPHEKERLVETVSGTKRRKVSPLSKFIFDTYFRRPNQVASDFLQMLEETQRQHPEWSEWEVVWNAALSQFCESLVYKYTLVPETEIEITPAGNLLVRPRGERLRRVIGETKGRKVPRKPKKKGGL